MVNLTPGELAALKAAAGYEPLGHYVRRVLLRHLERRSPKFKNEQAGGSVDATRNR